MGIKTLGSSPQPSWFTTSESRKCTLNIFAKYVEIKYVYKIILAIDRADP